MAAHARVIIGAVDIHLDTDLHDPWIDIDRVDALRALP